MPGNSMTFSVRGMAALEAMLKDLPGKADELVKGDALRAGAKVIAADAKARVPVATGALRDAIVVRKATAKQRRFGLGAVLIGFKKKSSYFTESASRRAHLTEFGTSTQQAQPFMRPAIDTQTTAALAAIATDMRKGVAKIEAELRGDFSKIRKRTKRAI